MESGEKVTSPRQIGIRHLLMATTACAIALMLKQTSVIQFMADTVWVPANSATLFLGGSIGGVIGHAYGRSALGTCRGFVFGLTGILFVPYFLQALLRQVG